ncbi:MAG TPA: hypothetical protein VGS57_22335 [Thermoanaerobaculia bacterium]|jgi:photosystem II stability/assembly factor-like uncharacterized protein|nr:hypothetical protein [Thermoanaerobaculia bacterium]
MRPLAIRCLMPFAAALAVASAVRAQTAPSWRSEGPYLANASDVAVDPSHADTVYVATHGGGVWRSDDGGSTWTLPGDEMTSRQVNWVLVDPGKSTTVWAGVEDAGLWRSLDKGATWKMVRPNDDQVTGARIAFAPTQPASIFVPSTNLHHKSADGGKTWSEFRVGNQDAYAIAVSPKDSKLVIAGGRGSALNLSRSTDGGKTWKQIGIGIKNESVRRVLFDPSNPSIVYAYAGFGHLFKSTNGGDEFEALPIEVEGTKEITDLEIDPANPQVLWAATEDGLKTSDDGGRTWRVSERGTGEYIVTAVTLVPGKPGTMFAVTGGGAGVFKSTDRGESWSPSNQGIGAAWIKKIWPPGKQPGTLYVQTNVGLFKREGSGGWSEVRQPFEEDKEADLDGMFNDRSAPGTAYAFDGSKYWKSTDAGRTWKQAEQKEPGLRQMMRGDLSSAEFHSMAQDAGDAKTFYAGAWSSSEAGKSVYRSTDAGKNWKPAANGLPEGAVSILMSPAAKTVYAVVGKEGVWRTRDGGGSWTNASSGLAGGEVRQLAVSASDPTVMFAATEHGLFQTINGGDAWRRTSTTLKEDDVEAVVAAPNGDVYAGAFEGIYRSTDAGATWTKMNGALANVDVRALAIEPGSPPRLYAGFGGGSVWSTPLP